MLRVDKNQLIKFRFAFTNSGSFYDPLNEATPVDMYASIVRGQNSVGDIVLSAVSVINSSYRIIEIEEPISIVDEKISVTLTFDIAHHLSVGDVIAVYGVGGGYDKDYTITAVSSNAVTAITSATSLPNLDDFDDSKHIARATRKSDDGIYFIRISESEYNFYYRVPENMFSGLYTLVIQTFFNDRPQTIEHLFQVSPDQLEKVGTVSKFVVSNGNITFTTTQDHGLSVGDFINLSEINSLIDGNYYIKEIKDEKNFIITSSVSISNQESFVFGYYKKINSSGVSGTLSGPTSGTKIVQRPIYDELEYHTTNSILLLGHADGININEITKINSIQEATNLLGANTLSPLLRGVYDAYSCGARNIYIMAVAPMSEYVDNVDMRLTDMAFLVSEETAAQVNFYEKYFERLQQSYAIAKNYEFIDLIVPLETSIIGTGDVNFIAQLALYCYDFNELTGYIQMGIIGSKTNGVKDSDIDLLEAKSVFRNKFTTYTTSGTVESDIGRFIIPIYGELNFNHTGFNSSYTTSAAAAFAGAMSSNPVYQGMIRKRIIGAYSLYGSNLSKESFARLDNLGINTVYRSRKAMRGNPYEVYVSNDYTMADPNSSLRKAPQVRLAAMVINEIKHIANNGIGTNSQDKVVVESRKVLEALVSARVINDYDLQVYGSKIEKGYIKMDISLVSSLGLKNVNFSVTSGRMA